MANIGILIERGYLEAKVQITMDVNEVEQIINKHPNITNLLVHDMEEALKYIDALNDATDGQ